MNRPVLALLLFCFFTFFFGLGRQAITDSDEGFYAEAAREMVESGDWLTPRFNYQNRFEKPVLYYWLTAATYLAMGPTETAARFWSAMSGVGVVLLTWAITPAPIRKSAASLAGVIVATSFGCFTLARWALPDLPLTFFITLTIWSSLRALERARRNESRLSAWALAGLAAGLGFLTKGPVAVAIPAIVIASVWWRFRRTIRWDLRALALAAAIVAVVGFPWYVLMWREHGAAYLQGFFVGDNVERFTTSRFNDARPVWFYLAVLLGGMLPWSVYLGTFTCRSLIDLVRRTWKLTDFEWVLLLWALMPLIFYTLSVGKQPRYILPVLPPVAVLLAHAITTRIEATRTDPAHGQPGLVGATWATAALCLGFAAFLVWMQPLFVFSTGPAFTWAGAGAAVCAAAALAWVAASRSWPRLPIVAGMSAAAVLLAFQFGMISGRRPEPVEQMAALVRANRGASEPVWIYRVFTRNLSFYTRMKHEQPFDIPQAAGFARASTRTLLVAQADDVKAIEAEVGAPLRVLGRVQYLNTTNIRFRTFFRPDPMDEVIEVLLVASR